LYLQGVSSLSKDYKLWLDGIDKCLISRLQAQGDELILFTHAMTVLATQGWERTAMGCRLYQNGTKTPYL